MFKSVPFVYDAIKSGLKAYSSRLYIARSRQITVYDAIKSGLKVEKLDLRSWGGWYITVYDGMART